MVTGQPVAAGAPASSSTLVEQAEAEDREEAVAVALDLSPMS
jgi:hypothetical protein